MTAPSFINGEWVIPDTINESDNPEVILMRKFEQMQSMSAVPEPAPQIQQQFVPLEQAIQPPREYVYTGPAHPLAQKGLEKLLQPPPDCESQLIQPKKTQSQTLQ